MKQFIAYKKSILISIGFLFLLISVTGQQLNEIRILLAAKQFAHAKQKIDSFLTVSESADLYLLKSEVYDSLHKNAAAKYLTDNALWQSFQALLAATRLDKNYVVSRVGKGNKLAQDIYNGFTAEGLAYFNAGAEKDDKTSFEEAVSRFKKAEIISRYLFEYGWKTNEIDTINLYFSAKAAIAAGQDQEALIAAKKIADYQLIYQPFKTGYNLIYEWLVYYFKTKKEEELFQKYLAAGRQTFPSSPYYNLAEADWLREIKDYKKLFALYRQIIKHNNEDFAVSLRYCSDMFNYTWSSNPDVNVKPAAKEKEILIKEMQGQLNRLIAKPKTADETINRARFLLGQLYTNLAQDIQAATKNTTTSNRYKQLLKTANNQLLHIIKTKSGKTSPVYKSVIELLITNLKALGDNRNVNQYEALLKESVFFSNCYLT